MKRWTLSLQCDKDCLVDRADGDGIGTRQFAIDGQNYEIELCDRHAVELAATLDPFITRARAAGQRSYRSAARPASSGRSAADRRKSREIRDWARAQPERYPRVSRHGRIPDDIVSDWEREAKGAR